MKHAPLELEDLAPAPYNPRSISDEAADGLGASISTFGDLSGIVWNERSRHLVAGHQRVEQLRKLGAQMFHDANGVPELRVGKDGKRFPIRVVDWDDATEKAANITANNPHIAGVFTNDLEAMLEEVRGSVGDEQFEALRLDELLALTHSGSQSNDEDGENIGAMTYSVIADFHNEAEQAALLEELESRGYKCRLLIA